jgi:hypothetical protein
MSELLDTLRREEPKYREFVDLCRRLQAEVGRAHHLEEEVEQLLNKAGVLEMESLLEFIQEALRNDPDHYLHIFRHYRSLPPPITMLRATRKWVNYLDRLLDLSRRLPLPEPPPSKLCRAVGREVELPLGEGIRRVWVQEVWVRPAPRDLIFPKRSFPDISVYISYKDGGELRREEIGGLKDLPLLLPLLEPLMGLLSEGISLYRTYADELEEFKRRIASEHSKEILMHDL